MFEPLKVVEPWERVSATELAHVIEDILSAGCGANWKSTPVSLEEAELRGHVLATGLTERGYGDDVQAQCLLAFIRGVLKQPPFDGLDLLIEALALGFGFDVRKAIAMSPTELAEGEVADAYMFSRPGSDDCYTLIWRRKQ